MSGLLADLGSAAPGAIVLLQACSHNPTGVDPTLQQWEQIRQLIRLKGLLPFFDSAYQVDRHWIKAETFSSPSKLDRLRLFSIPLFL